MQARVWTELGALGEGEWSGERNGREDAARRGAARRKISSHKSLTSAYVNGRAWPGRAIRYDPPVRPKAEHRSAGPGGAGRRRVGQRGEARAYGEAGQSRPRWAVFFTHPLRLR